MVGVTVSKAAAAGARTYLPSPSKKPAASELNVERPWLASLACCSPSLACTSCGCAVSFLASPGRTQHAVPRAPRVATS